MKTPTESDSFLNLSRTTLPISSSSSISSSASALDSFADEQLPQTSMPLPPSTSVSMLLVSMTFDDDDMNAEPRLSALRRWLNFKTPLSPTAHQALCILMRSTEPIKRLNSNLNYVLRPHNPAQGHLNHLHAKKCILCLNNLDSLGCHPHHHYSSPNPPPTYSQEQNHQRNSWAWFSTDSVVFQIFAYMSLWALILCASLISRIRRFRQSVLRRHILHSRRVQLLRQMHTATNYHEWFTAAAVLDILDGSYTWMNLTNNAIKASSSSVTRPRNANGTSSKHDLRPSSTSLGQKSSALNFEDVEWDVEVEKDLDPEEDDHGSHLQYSSTRAAIADIDNARIPNLCDDCDTLLNSPERLRKRQAECAVVRDDVDNVFDANMLTAKLRELSSLYHRGDMKGLAFALRASLIRNFAGMCHPRLHAHSRVGTDRVVEDYVYVVSYLLAYVSQSISSQSSPTVDGNCLLTRSCSQAQQYEAGSSETGISIGRNTAPQREFEDRKEPEPSKAAFNPNQKSLSSSSLPPTLSGTKTQHSKTSRDQPIRQAGCNQNENDSGGPQKLSINDKLTFLNEARHAYGRTALMLSGGAVMGLHHFGVVKGLLNEDLLPRVVCGTSAGALVASVVGTLNDDELHKLFDDSEQGFMNPITGRAYEFKFFTEPCTWWGRLKTFLRSGYLEDVAVLQRTLRDNYGDLTFQEAYDKTGRILNITTCPTRRSSDPPLLLNYLTAPHVLIWSAASASCALPVMFRPVQLVAKNASGRRVPYHPDGSRWIDGSVSSDVPLARIGELFNVNHFIVSQTNPHVIPRSLPILHTRVALLFKSELQFRYWQLTQLGLVPRLVSAIFPHFMQPYAGDVTIMPDVRLSDLTELMKNPSPQLLRDFLSRGELQTYPYLHVVRLHCSIERALDKCVEELATIGKDKPGQTTVQAIRRSSCLNPRFRANSKRRKLTTTKRRTCAEPNVTAYRNASTILDDDEEIFSARQMRSTVSGDDNEYDEINVHLNKGRGESDFENEEKNVVQSAGGRLGLFGRVPSWLWLDTRSLLPSGAVDAVTSRLSRSRQSTTSDVDSNAEYNSERNCDVDESNTDSANDDLSFDGHDIEQAEDFEENRVEDNGNGDSGVGTDCKTNAGDNNITEQDENMDDAIIDSTCEDDSGSDSGEQTRVIC